MTDNSEAIEISQTALESTEGTGTNANEKSAISDADGPLSLDDAAISSRRPRRSTTRRHRKGLNQLRTTSPDGRRAVPRIHAKLHHHNQQQQQAESTVKRTPSTVLNKLNHDELKSVKSHAELAETANGVRMLARNLSKATIQLDVRAIMVVTKARDNALIYLTRQVVEWFLNQKRDISVYVDSKLERLKRFDAEGIIRKVSGNGSDSAVRSDPAVRSDSIIRSRLRYWNKEFTNNAPETFDLVITLGGDGTVLYVSSLFQRIVPPVISFSLGSLGFLTNFAFDDFKSTMNTILDAGVKANLRMRFTCRVHKSDGELVCEQQVLNELVVDRGPLPYVTNLELYGDGSLLTVAQADGLIIATPTGSTAYSLSAGGSLVHPGVSAISVTPICPHTLSFRPILLPDGMFLKVKVPYGSRLTAWTSFDGKVRTELCQGDYVTIQASPFPFPTVTSSKTEYIDSVSRNLHWNVRQTQKPFTEYSLNGERVEDLEKLNLDDDFDINYEEEEVEEVEGTSAKSSRNGSRNSPRGSTNPSHNNSYRPSPGGNSQHGGSKFHNALTSAAAAAPNSSTDNSTDNTSTSSKATAMVAPRARKPSDISPTSTPSDDDARYFPSPGQGVSTPPSMAYGLDDRQCFAHPHAKLCYGSESSSSEKM